MFLKVTTPSDEAATAVVETAIECGGNPTELKQHRIPGTGESVFTVYLRGPQYVLDRCRMSIIKQKYYQRELFTFRTASSMATLAAESQESS